MSPAEYAVLLTVVGSVVAFGGAVVLAMGWAFRTGQFENFDRGARSIFGPDEPIGEPTDSFPGEPGPEGEQDPAER
jgi:nitrogen fixation-related uncharacterized protein